MVVWRCPHCATPQAEAARCWVCHRSTTSCSTCRHFRRSVASGLGMCGLDPRHVALTGAEMRVCWTAGAPTTEAPAGRGPATERAGDAFAEARVARTFVPVDELTTVRGHEPTAIPIAPLAPVAPRATVAPVAAAATTSTPRWSLWDEPER